MSVDTVLDNHSIEAAAPDSETSGKFSKEKLLDYFNMAVSLAVVFYGFAAFWGPYRWAAEIQLSFFGVYLVKLTGIIVFAVVYAGLMIVEGLLARILLPKAR